MGQLTAAQIITNGLAKAGRTNLTTLAQGWLNSWLSKAYGAWPWPFLTRKASGLSLVTGAQSLDVGSDATALNGVLIKRIMDPIWVYNTARTVKTTARIRTLLGGLAEDDEHVVDSATHTGIPAVFKVRADSSKYGKWALIPSPFPDRDCLLTFNYLVSPTRITDFDTAPLYPEDETMELCVEAHALRYGKQGAESDEKFKELAARVLNDRIAYGQVDGTNDVLPLDTGVFK
jgi:hypothetical protein